MAASAAHCPAEFITTAERLADVAGAVIRGYFRNEVAVELKGDHSPVTAADKEAEAAMRRAIAEAFPDHGVIGEEAGESNPQARMKWVLDPIDGTKSFITGKPIFGTLIALCDQGVPILGIIDQPVLAERWIGATGRQSVFCGHPARVRGCAEIGDAVLNSTSPDMFVGDDRPAFDRLAKQVRHAIWGGDCYAYGLLASGFVDLVVEAQLKPFDFAALVPVIEGAGGVMTDWQGERLRLGSDGRVVAAGDPRCHAQALRALAGAA